MGMLRVRDPWVIVSQLIKSGEPEVEVREVQDFFSAIVVLLKRSTPPGLRAKALEILRDTNRRGKIVWGSIEPYVIFFYHLAFEIESPEAAEELRKLIENSLKSSREDFPKFSHKLFELTRRGYEYKYVSENLRRNKKVRKLIWNSLVMPIIGEGTALLRLIADIILYRITGSIPRSFDYDYRDAEDEYDQLRSPPIEKEVENIYLIPKGTSISLVYEYFLRCARRIPRPDEYSVVRHELEEINSRIEQEKKILQANKFIIVLGWTFAFILFILMLTTVALLSFIITYLVIYFIATYLFPSLIINNMITLTATFLGSIFNGLIAFLRGLRFLKLVSQKVEKVLISFRLWKLILRRRKLEKKMAEFTEFI